MALVDSLLASFQQAQATANAANEARYQKGLEIFDKIIAQFQEGGAFAQATEAALATGEKRSVAQGMQSLVSSGLAGTTTAATLGRQFQEEVGTPARLAAESERIRGYTSALGQKAGFVERREDVGPSFSDIAGLAQSVGQGQTVRRATPVRRATTPSYHATPLSFGSSFFR
jgi:hypothetical protein